MSISKKDSPSLWCMHHIPSGKSLEGLLFDEVRAIATSTSKPKEWLVWKEGWPDWRLMSEHEGFDEPLFRPLSIASPPAIPETYINENTFDKIIPLEKEEGTSIINLVKEAVPIDSLNYVARKNERYLRRYEVIILFGKQEFKTHSVDVSAGGLKIEDPLPDWVGLQFKLRIKKGKNQIELLAYKIQSKHDPNVKFRVGFLPLKNEKDEANLESWLKAA